MRKLRCISNRKSPSKYRHNLYSRIEHTHGLVILGFSGKFCALIHLCCTLVMQRYPVRRSPMKGVSGCISYVSFEVIILPLRPRDTINLVHCAQNTWGGLTVGWIIPIRCNTVGVLSAQISTAF